MTKVAVLIPGIMGSELRLGDQVVWPGRLTELVLPYRRMAELTRDDLVVAGVIRSVSISNQYGALIDDLATCGFREDDNPPTLYPFPYDWRQDNRLAARRLADLLDAVANAHGPGTDISLVGHSMGGLIARFYLESEQFAARPGRPLVRRLITLGTPHRGSPLALTAAVGMEKRLFLSKEQVLQIASDPRFPALYQLLPPPGEPFAWDAKQGGGYEPLDIYDDGVAQALRLVRENLDAARAFHGELDVTKRRREVRYFFFTGTRQTTLTGVLLLAMGDRYRVQRNEIEDAGDATVPVWSASLTGVQGRPVGGEHGTIYKNDDLRRTLAALLGKPGYLAAEAVGRVEVAVRERVVNPRGPVQVVLSFPSGASEIEGEIRIERALHDGDGRFTGYVTAGRAEAIRYKGLVLDTLRVTLTAPSIPAPYRVTYHHAGAATPAGSDELFVQRDQPP
jgi:pimeloyl-ACP methyl ester carboxylesterase